MGKLIKQLCMIMVTIMCVNSCVSQRINGISVASKQNDSYARRRCVKLFSSQGSCSGVQIKAPSGHNFIMSAGHCGALADINGMIMVETEEHNYLWRKIVKVEVEKDLLLLGGLSDLQGLDIAKDYSENKHIRTFTHGRGFNTYETQGEMIQEVEVPIGNLILKEMAITAMIVPGSSGGMIVDDSNQLIGIASATDNHFGYTVPLHLIHDFISDK